jgi:hypothetical protein
MLMVVAPMSNTRRAVQYTNTTPFLLPIFIGIAIPPL